MTKHTQNTVRCVTRSGLLRVVVITPDEIVWRTYHLFAVTPEEAMRRALYSAGVRSAWTQAALPLNHDDAEG